MNIFIIGFANTASSAAIISETMKARTAPVLVPCLTLAYCFAPIFCPTYVVSEKPKEVAAISSSP